MPLVQTFSPRDDESGLGYYRRLAASNALRGWRELAVLAQVVPNRGNLLRGSGHVAEVLGLDESWTSQASHAEQRARAWRGLHRTAHDVICPACLREDVYIRHFWEHGYLTACPVHRSKLAERCPACGELLSPRRERIEQCGCGADLREGPSVPATAGQTWLSTAIASEGASTGGIAPKLHRVSVTALSELVGVLCLRMDPTVPPPRRSNAKVRGLQEAIEFLAPLDVLLAHWPTGFEQHVVERIQAGDPSARTLNSLLGRWWADVKGACQDDGPLRLFVEVVLRVAARTYDGRLGWDVESRLISDITGYVPLAEAAKALGVSRDRLTKACRAGQCGHRTRRFGTRGTAYEVATLELQRIGAQRAEWISEHAACELAQVSPAVMRNMVSAQVVDGDTRWRSDICKAGPIGRPSMVKLLETLKSHAKPHGAQNAEVMTWAEFTSRRMGDKHAIQALMQAAATGELVAVQRGRTIGQMGFLRSAVAPYFGTPLLEAGMSMQQLAKATGWKWESIAHWMSIGVLESHDILLRGQRCRVVSSEDLLSFRRTYLPLADLAKAMGTKSSALAEMLPTLDVIGAKPLPNGSKRGGLVRVADLGRLALLGARQWNVPTTMDSEANAP